MNIGDLLENFQARVDQMSEREKAKMNEKIEQFNNTLTASRYASRLRWEKALFQDTKDCVLYGEGEYHVYMWLHADGTPFYVGSGKGERWKNACCRNERFFEETKRLDTLVCKLIDGLTKEESREAEFCLSHYLSYSGYVLANWDNNYQRSVNETQADRRVGKFVRLMKKDYNNIVVEQAKKKMKPYDMPCDYNLIYEQYVVSYGYPV